MRWAVELALWLQAPGDFYLKFAVVVVGGSVIMAILGALCHGILKALEWADPKLTACLSRYRRWRAHG